MEIQVRFIWGICAKVAIVILVVFPNLSTHCICIKGVCSQAQGLAARGNAFQEKMKGAFLVLILEK